MHSTCISGYQYPNSFQRQSLNSDSCTCARTAGNRYVPDVCSTGESQNMRAHTDYGKAVKIDDYQTNTFQTCRRVGNTESQDNSPPNGPRTIAILFVLVLLFAGVKTEGGDPNYNAKCRTHGGNGPSSDALACLCSILKT